MIPFYTPWKHQKTRDFLINLGSKKETSGMKQVNLLFFFDLKHVIISFYVLYKFQW